MERDNAQRRAQLHQEAMGVQENAKKENDDCQARQTGGAASGVQKSKAEALVPILKSELADGVKKIPDPEMERGRRHEGKFDCSARRCLVVSQ